MNTSNKVCDFGHNIRVYQNSTFVPESTFANLLHALKKQCVCLKLQSASSQKTFQKQTFYIPSSHHFDMFSCFKSKNILFTFTKTDKNKNISKIMFPVEKWEHKCSGWVSECPTFCSSGCNEAEHQGGDEEEDRQEKRCESRGQHHNQEGNHISNVYVTQYS